MLLTFKYLINYGISYTLYTYGTKLEIQPTDGLTSQLQYELQ